MIREWQCPHCKQWVSVKYSGHTHAVLPREWDNLARKHRTVLGGEIEQWTYERKPDDPVDGD